MVPPPDWLLILGLLAALLIVLRGRGQPRRRRKRPVRLGPRIMAIIVTLGLIYHYVWTPTL